MPPIWFSRRRSATAVAVSLAWLLAACSGSSPAEGLPSNAPATSALRTSTAPAPTPSSAPVALPTGGTTKNPIRWYGSTTTGNPTKDAVILATKQYWSMFNTVSESLNTHDPAIENLTVEPQRSRVISTVEVWKKDAKKQGGLTRGAIRSVSVVATSATVDTCLDLNYVAVYEKGRPINPLGTNGVHLVRLTLKLAGSLWKVAAQDMPAGMKCAVLR